MKFALFYLIIPFCTGLGGTLAGHCAGMIDLFSAMTGLLSTELLLIIYKFNNI